MQWLPLPFSVPSSLAAEEGKQLTSGGFKEGHSRLPIYEVQGPGGIQTPDSTTVYEPGLCRILRLAAIVQAGFQLGVREPVGRAICGKRLNPQTTVCCVVPAFLAAWLLKEAATDKSELVVYIWQIIQRLWHKPGFQENSKL